MTRPWTLRRLRAFTVAHAFPPPAALGAAIAQLGFVQADPIRSPARAQDLILRHRVPGYRAGDLERAYPALAIEEDLLYAYGFVDRAVWRLLHPRVAKRPSALERNVLARVRDAGPTHPNALERHFGGARVVNAWGGTSRETTAALEQLHHRGLLRVARRENGIRVYDVARTLNDAASPVARLAQLALVVAQLLAPVDDRTLHGILARLARRLPGTPAHRATLRALLASGALERQEVDGRAYLWPAAATADAEQRGVRFLAPFDPLVWDRRRFEHLWGWPYRFEAYTPVAKRVRGYYAMPLLWGDAVIGWANAGVEDGALQLELGFVERRPRSRELTRELDAEIARLRDAL